MDHLKLAQECGAMLVHDDFYEDDTWHFTPDQLAAFVERVSSPDGEKEALRDSLERYRNGNTALLEALMGMAHQHCRPLQGDAMRPGFLSANENAFDVLIQAGMAVDTPDGLMLRWDALEARKPKQQTWAEAVNECVTDPAERARLLALDDAPPAPAAIQEKNP